MNDLAESRPYRDLEDLHRIWTLLQQGRLANNGRYYIHTGDINWWLFYPPLGSELWGHLFVWDDPDQAGRILGFALAQAGSFDVFVQPELHGSHAAWEMLAWGEARAARLTRQAGVHKITCGWILESDLTLAGYLSNGGYRPEPSCAYRLFQLEIAPSSVALPPGFYFSDTQHAAPTPERARAQYAAFANTRPWAAYLQRFARFRQSPVYDPELDVCVLAPDGRVASFCIVWPDPLNRVGLFEPVGTHPDFQGQGLGKAVLGEGLRRLAARGMRQAIVCTEHDNASATGLYQAVGFRQVGGLAAYQLEI